MKIRSTLLLCLVLVLLLAGCVVPVAAPVESTATAITPEAAAETTSAATAEVEEEKEEVAEATGECEEGYRLFDHELLESDPVCIPNNPERILPLDMASLEFVLLMGQTPVGTADWMLEEYPVLLPQFADALKDVKGLGYPAELEQVLLLEPDLILAPADTIDVAQAGQIAPVIVPSQIVYEDWKIGMEFWSEVLNASDLYAEMEANYWARVEELQTALGDKINEEISVVSVSTYGIWLWMPDSSPGMVLADVGLARPTVQSLVGDASIAEYGAKQYVEVSKERIDLIEGDELFYFTYAASDPEVFKMESDYLEELHKDPIWQSVAAVKDGHSYFVGGHWWRSQTYLLANLVIDDLFANLTDTTATTPMLEIQ